MKKQILLWILFSFSIVTITGTSLAQTEDDSQPPDDYQQLRDLQVFADTPYGQWAGSGDGLEIETDEYGALPVDTSQLFNDLPSYRVRVEGENGWWSFILAGENWESYSITPYLPDGALAFNIKGSNGGEDFEIALNDLVVGRDPINVTTDAVSLSDITTVTDEWQGVRIPLTEFIAEGDGFNLDQMFTIGFSGSVIDPENDEIQFWLNDIHFSSPSVEPGQAQIKMNQLGFTPEGQKLARISDFGDVLTAEAGTPFAVHDANDDQVVFQGELETVTDFDAGVSGEKILMADFSELQTPGDYFLSVDAALMENSPTFAVAESIYGDLLIDTLRYYYLQRAGMPLEEPYAGQFAREAGHMQDARAEFQSGERSPMDVAGGWYDAGDYGKYVNAGATAVSDLLWAYDMFPEQFTDGQLNIPESGNGIPDLLDEVRWELDWILKMQDSESGGFYHMVQPNEDTAVPDAQEPRFIEDVDGNRTNVRPTSTSASAVAALAHAARVFAPIDQEYADVLLAASKAGWQYLLDNPDGVASVPGPYSDEDDSDERFWAAAALYRATSDSEYHDYVKSVYQDIDTHFESTTDNAYNIGRMEMIGWLTYAFSDNTDPEMMAYFTTIFEDWSARMITRWQDSNWNVALLDEDFYWGSNYVALTTPLVMVLGSQALGEMDETAVIIAQDALNYLLGNNPLSFSYVSGFGENSMQNPFSNQWSYDNVSDVPAGILAGGPNVYTNPLLYSNFPAKRYVDSNASWTTNEHTIYWNSALVFHAALVDYLSQPGLASVVVPASEPTDEIVPESQPTMTSAAPVADGEAAINDETPLAVEESIVDQPTATPQPAAPSAETSDNSLNNMMLGLIITGVVLIIVVVVCTVIIVRAMKRSAT